MVTEAEAFRAFVAGAPAFRHEQPLLRSRRYRHGSPVGALQEPMSAGCAADGATPPPRTGATARTATWSWCCGDAEDRAVLLIANAADRPIPSPRCPPAARGLEAAADSGAGMLDPDLPSVAAGAAIEVEAGPSSSSRRPDRGEPSRPGDVLSPRGPRDRPRFRGDIAMNWDQIEGKGREITGRVQQQWGKLTDDDPTQIKGDRRELAGRIQQKYGVTGEAAEKQIDDWMNTTHRPHLRKTAKGAPRRFSFWPERCSPSDRRQAPTVVRNSTSRVPQD